MKTQPTKQTTFTLKEYKHRAKVRSQENPDVTYYVIDNPDYPCFGRSQYTITTEEGLDTFYGGQYPHIHTAYRDGYQEL